ncbi:MAG TPA: hypothetical protein VD788_15575 [Candidatus Polarisedimenticolaceae bacterium]|nr:hypothetical protein [Candidatus Polarisedimenticolaceae bacterium]
MDKAAPSMLRATLIGGAASGFVSGLPVVGALNCLCCSLVVGGGFLAAFLYSRQCERSGVGFRPGQGAWVGLVAAVFFALASTVTGAAARAVMPAPDLDQMTEMMDQLDLPPEAVDMAIQMLEMGGTALGILFMFLLNLLIGALFSTVGGLIGGAAFKVNVPPPPRETGPPTLGSQP